MHSFEHSAKVTRPDARAIEDQATALVAEHPHFRGGTSTIVLECRQETLIVRGSVQSFYLKQLLQTVLKDIEGVASIENRVDVVLRGDTGSIRSSSTE
jgi:hypothetical protein